MRSGALGCVLIYEYITRPLKACNVQYYLWRA
jgi:hypothetical protein